MCKMAAIGYQHFKLNTSSGGSVENRFEQGKKKKDCEKIKKTSPVNVLSWKNNFLHFIQRLVFVFVSF